VRDRCDPIDDQHNRNDPPLLALGAIRCQSNRGSEGAKHGSMARRGQAWFGDLLLGRSLPSPQSTQVPAATSSSQQLPAASCSAAGRDRAPVAPPSCVAHH
jgi:hypothetical protein